MKQRRYQIKREKMELPLNKDEAKIKANEQTNKQAKVVTSIYNNEKKISNRHRHTGTDAGICTGNRRQRANSMLVLTCVCLSVHKYVCVRNETHSFQNCLKRFRLDYADSVCFSPFGDCVLFSTWSRVFRAVCLLKSTKMYENRCIFSVARYSFVVYMAYTSSTVCLVQN